MKQCVFVIAGTLSQYNDYIRNKPLNGDKKYAYVNDARILKGYSNPHGVLIGTWRNRPDILDILEQIIVSSSENTNKLQKLYSELQSDQAPLYVHVNGVMQAENTDYRVSNSSIVFPVPPAVGDQITIQTVTEANVFIGDGTTNRFFLVRPTTNTQAINQAAQRLSDAIDQEVLKGLING